MGPVLRDESQLGCGWQQTLTTECPLLQKTRPILLADTESHNGLVPFPTQLGGY